MEGLEPKAMMIGVEDRNGYSEEDKKKKKGVVGGKKVSGGGSNSNSNSNINSMMRCCQAEKCYADLNDAKQYHKRHKVCEYHAKAQVVIVAGTPQRFCQQCSRFHELAEFDDTKRSCRRRLAGHNERRRKNSESQAEGSSGRKGSGSGSGSGGKVDDRGRIQITVQENAAAFQLR